jgi:RHS repeat-associated protein
VTYANPDAPTQIANGVSTTTFTYDNNGNVTQKTVDGTTTTYVWDYANRLTALGVGNATTSYSYDAVGNRVLQTGTSTTWIYPFKWYSVASSTGSGAKFATTTDYVFNGDTLVATVDQETASGNATGTAKTRYVHPDHLGSTNVVTDENGGVAETLDYYPYGATRINSASGNYSGAARQYVDRLPDQSGLDYFDARYYDPSRGQFITEDPVFLAIGSPQAEQIANIKLPSILSDPQQLNAYSYAENNPITKKDASGRVTVQALLSSLSSVLTQLSILLSSSYVAGHVAVPGLSSQPLPAASALLNRSLTVNPGAATITSSNQSQYGYIVNEIKQSQTFKTYVDNEIRTASKNGRINIAPGGANSVAFPSGSASGAEDLHLALHNANIGLVGSQSEDGKWNLNVTVRDPYNFELTADSGQIDT